MHRITAVVIAFLFSGCSLLDKTRETLPTATSQAQEVNRAQGDSLPRLGINSVTVRGSPDDAERALALKATAAGASYYRVLLVKETVEAGVWYASAIIYGPARATGDRQAGG